MKLCLDCPATYTGKGSRCKACQGALDKARNASPGRAHYKDDAYRAIPRPVMPCPGCGDVTVMTVDHIVPLARGGTNDPGNLQYLCRSCNSARGAA